MNNSIKAIIIDVGGVLYHPDVEPRKKWEHRLGLSGQELANIVFNNPITKKAKIGLSTPSDIWDEVQKQLNLNSSELEQFKVDMWTGSRDVELLNILKSFKGKYKLATMSDAWPDARENIKDYVNYELFDVILFSSEEGFVKPDPKFYDVAIQKLEVNPSECVFIDDSKDNVMGAINAGMKGIHYENTKQIHHSLLELLSQYST